MKSELRIPKRVSAELTDHSLSVFAMMLEEWMGEFQNKEKDGSAVFAFASDEDRDGFVDGYNAYVKKGQNLRLK